MVAIRIHGLAWRVETQEVEEFFADFKFIPDSVILGQGEDGRNNGLGAIVFETAEEADKAVEKMQKQYIGSRYVNLRTLDYNGYKTFNEGG
jgi:RNA recognition motif-containing protein